MSTALTGFRARLDTFVRSSPFNTAITALILVNAAILGLETYDLPDPVMDMLNIADQLIIYVFAVELLLKLYAWRGSFFRTGWN